MHNLSSEHIKMYHFRQELRGHPLDTGVGTCKHGVLDNTRKRVDIFSNCNKVSHAFHNKKSIKTTCNLNTLFRLCPFKVNFIAVSLYMECSSKCRVCENSAVRIVQNLYHIELENSVSPLRGSCMTTPL